MSVSGVGEPARRVEDERHLTGRGRFVADLEMARAAHLELIRSPVAHARILRIELGAARALRGVLAVLTAKDLADEGIGGLPCHFMPEDRIGGPPGYRTIRPVLAEAIVRHIGDRVVAIVAETKEIAKDAADLVVVDYSDMPAVTEPDKAVLPGATAVWPDCPGNLSYEIRHGDSAATEAAFRAAAATVSLRLVNNRVAGVPIEPRGAVGLYDAGTGSFELHSSTQAPHRIRGQLASDILRVPENRIRVVAHDVGGAFGVKMALYPEDVLVLCAARRLRRPVRWMAERSESFLAEDHGRDQVVTAELALDAKGRVLGLRADVIANLGAYISSSGPVPSIFGPMMLQGVYAIGAAEVRVRGAFTHTPPTGPYRGAGRPEATYVIERLMDAAARRLGLSPAEIRRRNLIPPAAMPCQTRLGLVYDSGEFEAVMDKALAAIDWEGFPARRAAARTKGRLRGLGIACYIEMSAFQNERMELRFEPNGDLTLTAGTFATGQGHETVYAQMLSAWTGVAPDRIRVVQGDTAAVSFGRGTFGSRSMTVGGSALKVATERVMRKARILAAQLLEADAADVEFDGSGFGVTGTDRRLQLGQVVRAAYAKSGVPGEIGLGLDSVGTFATAQPNYPNGCYASEIEIDPETGETQILAFVAADDVGVILNPMLVEGQIQGGVAQGIGQALMEAARFEGGTGQLLTGSLMDYALPRASTLPQIGVVTHEVPTKTNPLGVKGAGEAGAVGAPPAIINAVLDALGEVGVAHLDMPATPQRIWQALQAAARA